MIDYNEDKIVYIIFITIKGELDNKIHRNFFSRMN